MKPREWWISYAEGSAVCSVFTQLPTHVESVWTHVIEKSAYDAVVKERDALRSANLSKQIFLDQIEKESRQERDALTAQLAEFGVLKAWRETLSVRIERLKRALSYAKERILDTDGMNTYPIIREIEKLEQGR